MFPPAYGQYKYSEAAEEQRHFTIVMSQNTYPYQFVDDDGLPRGVLIDIWREWANKTNSQVTFKPIRWEETLDYVSQHENIIHAGLAITDSRLENFSFSETISNLSSYLFIHESVDIRQQVSDLVPFRIGIVSGSAHQDNLLAIEPKLTFKAYPTRNDLLDAAANGEVYVFAGIEGYQRNLTREQKITHDFNNASRLPIKQIALAAAVAKGNNELVKFINDGFSLIDPVIVKQIERRWLGYNNAEKAVLIAMQSGVEPYADIGADGLPHGLLVDLWQLWSEKTGIKIDFVSGDMNSSVDLIKRGLADVHIGYPESNELRTGLKQAWHITSAKSRYFSLPDKLNTLNPNANLRIGVFPTSPYINEVKSYFPNAQVKFFEDIELMTLAVQKGQLDGFVASSAMTSHHLLTHKLWAEFTQYSDVEFNTMMYSLTRLDDSGLSTRIREGFNLITAEEQFAIERKWLINPEDRYFDSSNYAIKLTSQEQAYLSTIGAIKMGYVKDWPPMEYQGANGEFLGINADIKTKISEQLGLTIVPVAYGDFRDVLADLISGEIQMVASVAYTPKRATQLSFSEPYWPSPWGIVTSLTQPPIFDIGQITGQRLAVIEGYHLVDKIRQRYPNVQIVQVDNIQAGMQAVVDGKADMFVEKVSALATLLNTGTYPSLKLSLISDLAEQHSQLALFPDLKNLMPLIDRVIGSIDENEQHKINQKWNSLTVKTDTTVYQRWIKIMMFSLVLLTVIVLTVVFANRRLNFEIKRRELAEEKLKHMANHDNVTQLPNRMLFNDRLSQSVLTHQRQGNRFAVLFMDLDGFKTVNDVHGHHVGDKLLKMVSEVLSDCVRESDTVARFGGDEFVVILNNIQSKEAAKQVADNILNRLNLINHVDDYRIAISASIGIAIFPDEASCASEILNLADKLMYQAKKFGGHQCKLS